MALAGDSEENDEKIPAFRAAQLHTRQAQQFHEKANSLQELLNLQSLHTNVNIMPAYFTLLQEEIEKLLGNAEEEVTIIYLCFPVSPRYNPPIPLHTFQTHLHCKPRNVTIQDINSWLDLSRWTERLSRGLLSSKIGSSLCSAKLPELQSFRKQLFCNGSCNTLSKIGFLSSFSFIFVA